jgi:hypothetical protein
MKHYTTEEYNDQLKNLVNDTAGLTWSTYHHLTITINRVVSSIHKPELTNLIFIRDSRTRWARHKALYKILHCTPLKKIPLYINTIPEIAQWRMRIGK